MPELIPELTWFLYGWVVAWTFTCFQMQKWTNTICRTLSYSAVLWFRLIMPLPGNWFQYFQPQQRRCIYSCLFCHDHWSDLKYFQWNKLPKKFAWFPSRIPLFSWTTGVHSVWHVFLLLKGKGRYGRRTPSDALFFWFIPLFKRWVISFLLEATN